MRQGDLYDERGIRFTYEWTDEVLTVRVGKGPWVTLRPSHALGLAKACLEVALGEDDEVRRAWGIVRTILDETDREGVWNG